MELPRQEYWSELPFPTPRDLPDQGIEPTSVSPALAGGLFIRVTWEAPIYFYLSPDVQNVVISTCNQYKNYS